MAVNRECVFSLQHHTHTHTAFKTANKRKHHMTVFEKTLILLFERLMQAVPNGTLLNGF